MKRTIKPSDGTELRKLIQKEMLFCGNDCDLNHIDVSGITNMSEIFMNLNFTGNISQWNLSNALVTFSMFVNCPFNGDISKWDVSNVKHMSYLFVRSTFTGDVSEWNTGNAKVVSNVFNDEHLNKPYWANIEDRKKAYKLYFLEKQLRNDLVVKEIKNNKNKI